MTAAELADRLERVLAKMEAREGEFLFSQREAIRESAEIFRSMSLPGAILKLPDGMRVAPDMLQGDPARVPVPDEQIAGWFTHHPPSAHPDPNVDLRLDLSLDLIRAAGFEMCQALRDQAPPGDDLDHALRCIRTAVMFANHALASYHEPQESGS